MKTAYIIAFAVLSSLQFGCRKEKDPTPAPQDHWKLVEEIKYEAKNASYCYSNGDLLYIRNLTGFNLLDAKHKLIRNFDLHTTKAAGYTVFPIVSDKVIWLNASDPSMIEFSELVHGAGSYGNLHFDKDTNITSLATDRIGFAEPAYIGSSSGYYVFKVLNEDNQLKLAIVDITWKNLPTIKTVDIAPESFLLRLLMYNKGKFYFSDKTGNRHVLYSMDSTGQYEKILDQAFFKMVNVNDTFYAINYERQLKLSYDEGENWIPTTLSMSTFNLINVDGKAMYFKLNSIGQLKIDGDQIQGIEFNSKGLEGHEITWICKHNNRYYCTTKSGVYYIEEEYFKPVEE